jgi:glycosyltransferase involved in cell wall biosynthesis
MKLLVLTNNPERSSFRQRVVNYLDIFRANGVDCEVAKLPPNYLSRWKLFKLAAKFDGVFLHKKCLNFLDAIVLRKYSRKIIYNFDDAVMYNDKKPDKQQLLRLASFRRTVKLADMIIVGSSYLAEQARRFNNNVKTLPIGLRVSDYQSENSPKSGNKVRLVWIGSKSTLHYLEEIKPALEKIGSHFDNVILRIICDNFFNLKNMQIEKYIWSEQTRGADLAECDIGLAPLHDNRFSRGKCSFKVLEYAAAGLPAVASPIGTNADYIQDKVTGLLATNAQEWVDRISWLIENPQLRKKMGQESRAHAAKFDVSVIGKQLTELIKECLSDNL